MQVDWDSVQSVKRQHSHPSGAHTAAREAATSQGLWFSVLNVCVGNVWWNHRDLEDETNPFITGQAFCLRTHELPCNISGQKDEHNEGRIPQHDSQMVGGIANKLALGISYQACSKGLRPQLSRNLGNGIQVVFHRLTNYTPSWYTWIWQIHIVLLAQTLHRLV